MSRRKVSTDALMTAIRKWLNGEGSQRSIAREIGIDSSLFRTYLARYKSQGISGIIESVQNKVYSSETKLKAVTAYINGEGSLRAIAGAYGLRSEGQLRKWIKVYNGAKDSDIRCQEGAA